MDLVFKLTKMETSIQGNTKNGLPNGQGKSIYPDGSMYLGEYKDGKFHGQGTETLPNGQLVGEYKDGKPWNVKGYDKEGNIIEKWVNGKMIKQ